MQFTTTKKIVRDIERRAHHLNLTIREVSRRAKLSRSTFQRWKAGSGEASLTSVNKILRVLEQASTGRKG